MIYRKYPIFPVAIKPLRKHDNLEARITLSCLKYLKMKGYAAGKIKTVGGRAGNHFIRDPYQWTGVADILLFMPCLVFIEVKAEKGVQSPHQKDFQEFCNKARVPYLLVRSLAELQDRIIELEDKNT